MSSNSTSIVIQLSTLPPNINRYGSLVVFILGSIGVLLNILIFGTDQELKKTPCSRLFLGSSIASSMTLFFGLPTRFFASFGLDLTARYDILCKGYMVILLSSYSCSALFTSFLSVERWLNSCTDANLRMLSSMKNAYRVVIIIPIIVLICYSQIFYCYLANQKTERGACSPMNSICLYFNDFLHLLLFVIIPSIIMVIYGSLTLYNIKKNLGRIAPQSSTTTTKFDRRTMRTQSTITILMFTQIGLLTFCNLPSGVQKVYSTITANDSKSTERRAIELVCFQFVYLFNFVGAALPFYLYTLAGKVFREALRRRMRMIFPCCAIHRNLENSITLQKGQGTLSKAF